jgi:hypothetical protein
MSRRRQNRTNARGKIGASGLTLFVSRRIDVVNGAAVALAPTATVSISSVRSIAPEDK